MGKQHVKQTLSWQIAIPDWKAECFFFFWWPKHRLSLWLSSQTLSLSWREQQNPPQVRLWATAVLSLREHMKKGMILMEINAYGQVFGYFLLPRRRKPRKTEHPQMPAPAWGRESSSLNRHAAAGYTSRLCPAARKAEAPPSCYNKYPGSYLGLENQHVSPVEWHIGPPQNRAAVQWQHNGKPSAPRLSIQLKVCQDTLSASDQARSRGTALLLTSLLLTAFLLGTDDNRHPLGLPAWLSFAQPLKAQP